MSKPIDEILEPKPDAPRPRIYAYAIPDAQAGQGVIQSGRGDPMLTRDTILAELRRMKPEFARRYGVNRMALFGSFAKDTAHPDSDIDVVVELAEPDLFDLVHIKVDLESGFQRRVDVIPYTALMNGFLKARIQSEAVYV